MTLYTGGAKTTSTVAGHFRYNRWHITGIMWTRLKSLQFSKKTIPWAFVLVTILAYGLLAPWLGFYWDDWVFVWLLEHRGPLELARSFLPYDPLVSPFFLLSSSLLGTHPFAWQVFGLAVRALVGLAALWTFNQIWPKYSRKVAVGRSALFWSIPAMGSNGSRSPMPTRNGSPSASSFCPSA